MAKLRLTRPFEKDGKKVEEFELNLDTLKGSDIVAAEREARIRGDTSPNPLFSSLGAAIIAARVSGWIVDDVLNLPAPDFLIITDTVTNFLYGWTLPAGALQEASEESP